MFSFKGNATTGKQGLGIRSQPKKVAGCRFQGKKTSFSDSDDEDISDLGHSAKRKRDDLSEGDRADKHKVKLKKLCKKLLRQVSSPNCKFLECSKFLSLMEGLSQVPGESLKLKQLKLLIDEHSSSVFSNFSSKRDAVAYLKQKVCCLATVEHFFCCIPNNFCPRKTIGFSSSSISILTLKC